MINAVATMLVVVAIARNLAAFATQRTRVERYLVRSGSGLRLHDVSVADDRPSSRRVLTSGSTASGSIAGKAQAVFGDVAATITAKQFTRTSSVVAVPLVAVAALSSSPALILSVVGAGVLAGFAVARSRKRRTSRQVVADLPDFIEAVGRASRSGRSLDQSIDDACAATPGPCGDLFAAVVAQSRRGAGLGYVLVRASKNQPQPAIRIALTALALAHDSGAAPGQALYGVAQSLRDRASLQAEIVALVSQARTSGLVMAALPVVFMAISAAADPEAVTFFVADPIGRLCLLVGLGLDAAGMWWMHALVRRVA